MRGGEETRGDEKKRREREKRDTDIDGIEVLSEQSLHLLLHLRRVHKLTDTHTHTGNKRQLEYKSLE